MKKFLTTKILLLLFLIISFSCVKKEKYPIEPIIKFKSFTITYVNGVETGILTITFTDGDGDLGLAPSDTLYPFNKGSEFYYNFFMTFYQQKGEVFEKVNTPYNVRIPSLNPDNIPQNLSGEIQISIDLSIVRSFLESKRFKIEAYLYDKALHKSNTITTDVIELK